MGRVVIALGGNALLKRGEPMTAGAQRRNARIAAEAPAGLCAAHQTVITHGNGPQVGMPALQKNAFTELEDYPLDVLGAETEGMIGYRLEQELRNVLPFETPIATLLTIVEVNAADPAFDDPTTFIGKVYAEAEAKTEAAAKGWTVKPDGKYWRRAVPSPSPKRIFQLRPIEWLLEKGAVVIAAGGGAIPTMCAPGEDRRLIGVECVIDKDRRLIGVECVIDKDRASALLAKAVGADFLVIAIDVDGVCLDWSAPNQRAIRSATPNEMDRHAFPAGSMEPKVEAAQDFARTAGKRAVICALADMPAAVRGEKGTTIRVDAGDIRFH